MRSSGLTGWIMFLKCSRLIAGGEVLSRYQKGNGAAPFRYGCAQEDGLHIQRAMGSSASSIPGMTRKMDVSHSPAQDDTTGVAGALAVAGRQERGSDPSRKLLPQPKSLLTIKTGSDHQVRARFASSLTCEIFSRQAHTIGKCQILAHISAFCDLSTLRFLV
jgi:hypothetical protein